MVRGGLKDFIQAYDWMEAVGEAPNGLKAVEFCAAHDVDVILMDMVMPLMDGSEATRRILAQGNPVKVIVLTSFHERDLVQQALKAGATSYLLKNVNADELAEAIWAAHGGFSTLAPEATKALIDNERLTPGPRRRPDRERARGSGITGQGSFQPGDRRAADDQHGDGEVPPDEYLFQAGGQESRRGCHGCHRPAPG